MLLYPSFEPFYIQLRLLCVKLYTCILQSWKKNAALIHQTYLCLIFCGLIYFSNFSRPGSSPSNSSSRHRIGKCKLIFDTGYTSMGREIDFKILQYELVLDRMSLLITLDFNTTIYKNCSNARISHLNCCSPLVNYDFIYQSSWKFEYLSELLTSEYPWTSNQ